VLVLVSHHADPLFGNYPVAPLLIRLVIVMPLFLLGLLFAVWSNLSLFVKGKGGPTEVFNIAISPRSENLVVTGPYRFSRNPMVFGALCIYFSVALLLNSPGALLLLVCLIPLVILYLKKTEEKRLLRDFGEAFLEFKARIPMIVPFTKVRKQPYGRGEKKTIH
jgi:protein-S-isoprenylcysteine O-methyltransferase Ste14